MQIEKLKTHAPVWVTIQQMLDKNRLPHALLFIGPRHAEVLQFVNRLMAILICKPTSPHPPFGHLLPMPEGKGIPDNVPCGQCQPCHLLMQGTHPDIKYVRQDTPSSPIKIEQIRELQESVYQTPQCGTRSIIVIEPADRLNRSAANALLKILEEPPLHTLFILIAEHISSLPATIMSRCQQYTFRSPELFEPINQVDYLTIGQFYPEASERAGLFKQCQPMIDNLCDLLDKKISPCTLASKWSSHSLGDLLWFLYLITAQAIRYRLVDCHTEQPWADKLRRFSSLVEPVGLFQQLDRINLMMNTVQQNITLNQTLAIETLLMEWSPL